MLRCLTAASHRVSETFTETNQPCDSPANHNAFQRQHMQNARSGHYVASPVGASSRVMHDWDDDLCVVRIAPRKTRQPFSHIQEGWWGDSRAR